MKWLVFVLLTLDGWGCGAGDDTTEGTRGQCAFGGELNDCPDAERTPTGACWRLVDCGRIAVDVEDPNDPNRFDWGVCVDGLERLTDDRQHLVINCIAAATCDELRTNDVCLDLGQ